MPKPNPPSEADYQTPADAFAGTLDAELKSLFRDLVHKVSYLDYAKSMSAKTFRALSKLVVYDRWWEAADDDVCRWLSVDGETLKEWRKGPEYKSLDTDLERAFYELAEETNLAEMLKDSRFENRMVSELRRLALYAADERVRERAVGQITDRMVAPLKDPGEDGAKTQNVFIIQGPHAEAIAAGMAEGQRLLEGEVVDGECEEVHEGAPAGSS